MTLQCSARTNIVIAMAAKLLTMGVAVLSVPLLLGLLGTQIYGTWVTLTSLIAFISILDLGVGNSVRNSVSRLDTNAQNSVRAEFVGFFQLLFFVALICLLLLAVAMNSTTLLSENRLAAALLYGPPLLLLPLLLGPSVLQGARATGLQSALQSATSWLFFALVLALVTLKVTPTLPELAIAWSVFYALVLGVTFALALRTVRVPARHLFRWSVGALPKGRLKIGGEFLALQLTSLVLYSLGNAIIFHELGAGDVARYDVLNKIFQVGLSFYTVVIGVVWSEISKHRATPDPTAMARILRRLAAVSIAFAAACAAGAFVAPTLIDHWTQHQLQVTLFESFTVAALVSVQSIAYVGAVFMNAFEQIRIQVLLGCVSIVLMIPLSIALIQQGLGIAAVPLAAMALTVLPAIVCNRNALRLVGSMKPPAQRPA